MAVVVLSIVLCLTFLILSSFHFYWLFGGIWGLNKVIPSKEGQLESLTIPKFGTFIVALVLLSFGFIYLLKSQLISIYVPNWITEYGYWIVPSIFMLRAIGDFNYVGFFKKIKHSEFAKADTQLFIPLCLGIGVLGIVINLITVV